MANSRPLALAFAAILQAMLSQPAIALPPGSLSAARDPAAEEPRFDRAAANARIARVAYRLALHGAPHCRVRSPLTGMMFHHLAQYPPADHARLGAQFHLDRGPGILAVAEDSPAARAGIRSGDVLVAIDGVAMPVIGNWGDDARVSDTLMHRFYSALEAGLARPEVHMTLVRGQRQFDANVRPEAGCALRPRLAHAGTINAFADGDMVVITDRLLEFVRDDDDMAAILAHELAHNILSHYAALGAFNPRTKRARRRLRESALVREMEREADALSVRLLAAAGYRLAAAPALWARLPGAATHRSKSHASLEERTRSWNEAVRLEGQQAHNLN